jgi:hypothetical protein
MADPRAEVWTRDRPDIKEGCYMSQPNLPVAVLW